VIWPWVGCLGSNDARPTTERVPMSHTPTTPPHDAEPPPQAPPGLHEQVDADQRQELIALADD
jgi:hypothetical protein